MANEHGRVQGRATGKLSQSAAGTVGKPTRFVCVSDSAGGIALIVAVSPHGPCQGSTKSVPVADFVLPAIHGCAFPWKMSLNCNLLAKAKTIQVIGKSQRSLPVFFNGLSRIVLFPQTAVHSV